MQVGSVIRRRVTNRGGTREERGRLKTQDYTRLRDSINGMYKASRAREAQLIDLFLADTLDVDDFLRLKNRNANAPKVAYQVCIDAPSALRCICNYNAPAGIETIETIGGSSKLL